MKRLFRGSIRQLALDLCWEAQQDPLREWMSDEPSTAAGNEREESCFVVMKRPRKFPSVSRISYVGLTDRQQAEFTLLAEWWRRDVMFSSDTIERVMHPAYQRIIGMGPSILPLLLREVVERHEHWFWALESISGEDPVSPDDSGDVAKISKAWIEWGRQRGLLR